MPATRALPADFAAPLPPRYAGLPAPLPLPLALRPLSSAETGVERLPDDRTKYWIRHDVLRGVTPRMIAWWFANLEGTISYGGRDWNRYRFWHPNDHVHASYCWRRPDGRIGPGAAIRLIEVLGRDPRFVVDTTWNTRSPACPPARSTRTAVIDGIGGRHGPRCLKG